jgi:HK97 family phage major capsid protein
MPLSIDEMTEIKGGFSAAGDRINTLEQRVNETSAAVTQAQNLIRKVGRAVVSRELDGEEYRGFWPNEEAAREFGEIIVKVVANKSMSNKALTETTSGGVLVPTDLATWIIQKLGKYGKFRRNAMVVPLGAEGTTVPRVTSDLTIYCPGESTETPSSDMMFQAIALVCRRFCAVTAVSSELEEDSLVGIAEIIGLSITRSMAKREDEIGFMGDGTSEYFHMTGIVGALRAVHATIASIAGLVVASGNLYSEITLADFRKVIGILPEDCDETAKWYMHKRFYHSVVWPLAEAAGVANIFEILSDRKDRYLLGYPVVFVHCMPYAEANSQICAILGDLQMGAYLGQRRELRLDKSTDVYFSQDAIAFRGTQRIAINAFGVGDTTDAGPIVGLITAAT